MPIARPVYYSISCLAASDIPDPDRLFYAEESELGPAGFTKAKDC